MTALAAFLVLLVAGNAVAIVVMVRLLALHNAKLRELKSGTKAAMAELEFARTELLAFQSFLEKTHDGIRASKDELAKESRALREDFALKMRAMKQFIALWNEGRCEEATAVLSKVGFTEATLQ